MNEKPKEKPKETPPPIVVHMKAGSLSAKKPSKKGVSNA